MPTTRREMNFWIAYLGMENRRNNMDKNIEERILEIERKVAALEKNQVQPTKEFAIKIGEIIINEVIKSAKTS